MTEARLRKRIARICFTCNSLVFFSLVILFMLNGFFLDEFSTLLVIIAPITVAYMTPIIRYMAIHRHENGEPTQMVTSGFSSLSNLIIPLHFVTLLALIYVSAFNFLSFEYLKIILGFEETFFGIYVGYIILALFPPSVQTPEEKILQSVKTVAATATQSPISGDFKEKIRAVKYRIMDGKTTEAIQLLLQLAEAHGDKSLANQVINLSGQFEDYKAKIRTNMDDDTSGLARINAGILEIVDKIQSA